MQVSRPIRVPAPLPDNSLLRKMPPPHVPPLCAPTQSETVHVQSSDQDIDRCAYWPKCKLNRSVCNGHTTEQCKVYGICGTNAGEAPTGSELSYLKRQETWKYKDAKCAWSPYCRKAIDCRGKGRICAL